MTTGTNVLNVVVVFSLLITGGMMKASEKPESKQPVGGDADKAMPQWDGKESIADYAKRVGLEPTLALDLGNKVKLELVLIPAGKFTMGKLSSEEDHGNNKTQHEVTLTKPFYIGKYTVTQEQYQQVMGSNPSNFKGKDNPVEMVSLDDAQEFCKKLGQTTNQTLRLPTDAEWEYACRAGTSTSYYSGDTENDLKRVAWYAANSNGTTHPVGQKEPNRFGLFDMHGNVWQWCQDWYEEYKPDTVTDPQGPAKGVVRVLHGGSWNFAPFMCRSVSRDNGFPGHRCSHFGFRVVVATASRTH